jgi:hypothetical protein
MATPRMTTQTLAVLSTILSDPDTDWYGLELSKRSRPAGLSAAGRTSILLSRAARDDGYTA